MSRRRKSTDTTPFDTLRLEGSLFVPELLERAASGEATFQKETDYAIPKGLKLHDEYGRAFRIATATWQSFAPQTARADLDAAAVTRAFAVDFLRQCLGYTDLTLCPAPLDASGEQRMANGQGEAPIQHSKSNIQNSPARGFPVTAMALGGRLPVIIAPHHLGLDDPDPRFAIIGSGSRKKSAHQLAQEFLNASTDSLWAIVTNGRTLRLLRDADTLTRPNFLEFDLETILRDDQHRYADFSALWRILHASRAGTNGEWRTASGGDPSSLSPLTNRHSLAEANSEWRMASGEDGQDSSSSSHSPLTTRHSPPNACVWEKWKSEGHAQGLRVRDGLRDGVTEAILILGRGFLTHPDNTALRQRLHDGTLTLDDYFQQFFRLIYRCLFLFCTEERDLLHPPEAASSEQRMASGEDAAGSSSSHSQFATHHSHSSAAARKAYSQGYSLRRLRSRALRQSAHDPHGDLWLSLRIVFRSLASGQEKLALPALGGLFAETQCPDLDSASLSNRDLLSAMRELRWFYDKKTGKRSAIDYRNMGTEELGSVYESLLELVPTIDLPARTFGFVGITDAGSTSGNARKTTGSYYTADPLVMELIKSALDPVIADRLDNAKRMANGKWRTEDEKQYAYQLISRLGRLESGSGPRREDLRNHQGTAAGGTLRPDQPDAEGGRLHSVEYGGRLGPSLPSGVHPVPEEIEWQPHGTGNPAHHCGAGEASQSGNRGGEPRGTGDHREAVAESGALDSTEQGVTEEANGERRTANGEDSSSHSRLTTRHSPEDANGEQRIASCEDGYDSSSHSPLATRHSLEAFFSSTPFAIRYSLLACEALLRITVCDPSCGSGHFLLAAARRLAETLAELRSADGAVRPDDYRHALREVASRCLYGVDINPMAVELCRVALWLETVDPGKPLGVLNHHIRHGNSLLGTTPDLIAAGLPDETFTAIAGDDKPACAELKKRNKAERTGFGPLFAKEEDGIREKLRQAATSIEAMDDSQPDALQKKEAAFLTNETAPETRHAKLLADLWCAAFVIKKRFASRSVGVSPTSSSAESPISSSQSLFPDDDLFGQPVPASKPTAKPKYSSSSSFGIRHSAFGITTGTLHDFVQGKPLPEDLKVEVNQLAEQYRFFHWHLAFPQVFDKGGFDCILGNPPWERPKPEPAKYFAASRPDIANAQTSAVRGKLILQLQNNEPAVFARWADYERSVLASVAFQTASGSFPLSSLGKFNLGNTFVEKARSLLNSNGRSGLINVSGLATDDSGKALIADLMNTGTLVSFYDFENREGIFPAVDSRYKFSAITVAGSPNKERSAADFVFFAQKMADLQDPDRHIEFTADDIELLNPISGNCPVFRERSQAEIVKALYRRAKLRKPTASVLWEWDAEPTFLFVMSDHSDLFATREKLGVSIFVGAQISPHIAGEQWLPLYESKMFHQFEHRWTSLNTEGTQFDFSASMYRDPESLAIPRYWMRQNDAARKLGEIPKSWLIAVREVTNATNERTVIASTLPKYPVGHNAQVFNFRESAANGTAFLATLNSYVLDFAARTKVGGSHLSSFILRQLPILPSVTFDSSCPWAAHPQSSIHDSPSLRDWLLPRVLELTYTAWDLEAFAADCLAEANSEQRMASGEDISSHSPLTTHHSPEDANSEQRMANGKDVGDSSTSSLSPFATPHSPEGFAGYWRRYSPHSPFTIRLPRSGGTRIGASCCAASWTPPSFICILERVANGEWRVGKMTIRHLPLAIRRKRRIVNIEWRTVKTFLPTRHLPLTIRRKTRIANSEWRAAKTLTSLPLLPTRHSPLTTRLFSPPSPRPAMPCPTSWTPSPSSNAKTKPNTAPTAPRTPSSKSTTPSQSPSPPAPPTKPSSIHPPPTRRAAIHQDRSFRPRIDRIFRHFPPATT
jgi:hypothetical protein